MTPNEIAVEAGDVTKPVSKPGERGRAVVLLRGARACTISGCTRPAPKGRFCWMHYKRLQRRSALVRAEDPPPPGPGPGGGAQRQPRIPWPSW